MMTEAAGGAWQRRLGDLTVRLMAVPPGGGETPRGEG